MRAFARIDHKSLAEGVEASLKRLGYSYLKNQGSNVTEFDVQSPCHFIVTAENLTRTHLSFLFISRVRVESAIEFKRKIGAKEAGPVLSKHISALVQDLCSDLPDERWKGLRALRSMSEKTKWEEQVGS